jgi:hypothetical protein
VSCRTTARRPSASHSPHRCSLLPPLRPGRPSFPAATVRPDLTLVVPYPPSCAAALIRPQYLRVAVHADQRWWCTALRDRAQTSSRLRWCAASGRCRMASWSAASSAWLTVSPPAACRVDQRHPWGATVLVLPGCCARLHVRWRVW